MAILTEAKIRRLFLERNLRKLGALDDPSRLEHHAKVLDGKPLLKSVFREFHRLLHLMDQRYFTCSGARVELGSGVMPMRHTYPDVFSSDVVWSARHDLVLDANNLGLKDNSVRALFGQNCFHHFSSPRCFFSEADRVLKPGGGIVLIEPWFGLAASMVYPYLFDTEIFDKSAKNWESKSTNPMTGANQALSYIIFRRDLDLFERENGSLRLVDSAPVRNYCKYIASGGLNFKQLVPHSVVRALDFFQWLMRPLDRALAMHWVIVIRKVR